MPRVPPTERTASYRVVTALTRPLIRPLFRPQTEGLEHVPERGGFVLASSQLSNLDGFALAFALFPRQLRWMAKTELFVPVFGAVARSLGLPMAYQSSNDVRRALAAALPGTAYSETDKLAFTRPIPARNWLQASNPSERWKWDFMFQDLPPVKFLGKPVATSFAGLPVTTKTE